MPSFWYLLLLGTHSHKWATAINTQIWKNTSLKKHMFGIIDIIYAGINWTFQLSSTESEPCPMLSKASLRIVQGCCLWWSDFRPGLCECHWAYIEAGTPRSPIWRGAMWIFWVHGSGNTWEKCYLTMGQSIPFLPDWKCVCNQICDIGMLMHHTWMHMDAGAAGPYNFTPPASYTDPTSPLFQTKTCSMEWASVFLQL